MLRGIGCDRLQRSYQRLAPLGVDHWAQVVQGKGPGGGPVGEGGGGHGLSVACLSAASRYAR